MNNININNNSPVNVDKVPSKTDPKIINISDLRNTLLDIQNKHKGLMNEAQTNPDLSSEDVMNQTRELLNNVKSSIDDSIEQMYDKQYVENFNNDMMKLAHTDGQEVIDTLNQINTLLLGTNNPEETPAQLDYLITKELPTKLTNAEDKTTKSVNDYAASREGAQISSGSTNATDLSNLDSDDFKYLSALLNLSNRSCTTTIQLTMFIADTIATQVAGIGALQSDASKFADGISLLQAAVQAANGITDDKFTKLQELIKYMKDYKGTYDEQGIYYVNTKSEVTEHTPPKDIIYYDGVPSGVATWNGTGWEFHDGACQKPQDQSPEDFMLNFNKMLKVFHDQMQNPSADVADVAISTIVGFNDDGCDFSTYYRNDYQNLYNAFKQVQDNVFKVNKRPISAVDYVNKVVSNVFQPYLKNIDIVFSIDSLKTLKPTDAKDQTVVNFMDELKKLIDKIDKVYVGKLDATKSSLTSSSGSWLNNVLAKLVSYYEAMIRQ